MATIQRPVKRGNVRKFDDSYQKGFKSAQASEVDADFDTLYDAWNFGTINFADGGVTTAKLADGSVTNAKLATDSVSSANIINGTIAEVDISPPVAVRLPPPYGPAQGSNILAVDPTGSVIGWVSAPPASLVDGQVITRYIADAPNGVTDAKITSVAWSKITGAPAIPTALPPNGAAGGDLAGTYPSPTVGLLKVTDAKINDVAATKLTGTIPQARFPVAPSGIVTANINDGQVTDAKIATVSYGKVTGAPGALPPTGTAGGALVGNYPNPTLAANSTLYNTNQSAVWAAVNANATAVQFASVSQVSNGRHVYVEIRASLAIGISASNQSVNFAVKRNGVDIAFWFVPCGAGIILELPLPISFALWDYNVAGTPVYTWWMWTSGASANVHTTNANPGFAILSIWA